MFFPIQPFTSDPTGDQPVPRPSSSPNLDKAIDRVLNQSDHLTGDMRSSLTATLTVLHRDFPNLTGTGPFTARIIDPLTSPHDLLLMADQISHGLTVFLAKGGGYEPPADRAVPTKSKPSRRSTKIRKGCYTRDNNTCALCRSRNNGASCHIIPFSVSGSKSLDFWAFIALFLGESATAEFQAAALDPDPTSPDNLMNVMYLCHNCHALFDDSKITFVPTVLTDPLIMFPYDPSLVASYTAVAEFPFGPADYDVAVKLPTGVYTSLQPGHIIRFSTLDPMNRPLPHPLLLQLHAVVSRVVRMKAAAGYPVFRPSWGWGYEYGEEDVALTATETDGEETENSDASATTFVDAWLQTDKTVVVSPSDLEEIQGQNRDGSALMEEKKTLEKQDLRASGFYEVPRNVDVVHGEFGARMEERRELMLRRLEH